MGIRVVSVTPRGGTLRIVFAEPFLNTDAGNRAFRVIFAHAHHGFGADDRTRTLDLNGGADVTAINTREALQAELDRHANTPITITFGKPQLGASGRGPAIKTRADIRTARAAGRTVWVQMKVTASMPLVQRDFNRLQEFVPGGVYHINEDPYSCWVVVYMQGDREQSNAWGMMRRLKPQIQAAIA